MPIFNPSKFFGIQAVDQIDPPLRQGLLHKAIEPLVQRLSNALQKRQLLYVSRVCHAGQLVPAQAVPY
jgi:hypothetical protein